MQTMLKTKHNEVKISQYPELSWEQIKSVLERNGFSELRTDDKHYAHLQKGAKNIKIVKLLKVPRLFLHHIILTSEIPIEEFLR